MQLQTQTTLVFDDDLDLQEKEKEKDEEDEKVPENNVPAAIDGSSDDPHGQAAREVGEESGQADAPIVKFHGDTITSTTGMQQKKARVIIQAIRVRALRKLKYKLHDCGEQDERARDEDHKWLMSDEDEAARERQRRRTVRDWRRLQLQRRKGGRVGQKAREMLGYGGVSPLL